MAPQSLVAMEGGCAAFFGVKLASATNTSVVVSNPNSSNVKLAQPNRPNQVNCNRLSVRVRGTQTRSAVYFGAPGPVDFHNGELE